MSIELTNTTQNFNENNFINHEIINKTGDNETDNSKLISFKPPAQIQVSMQYSRFKSHPLQRNLEIKNLQRLRESVEQRDMLNENPIHVTPSLDPSCDYWVFDGNHRFQICCEKQLPVYFIVRQDFDPLDMVANNFNLSKWGVPQFMEFYIKLGNVEYEKFKKFYLDFNIHVYTALPLTKKQKDRYKVSETFRKGNFLFENEQEIRTWIMYATNFLNKCMEYGLVKQKMFRHVAYFDGYARVMEHPSFNQEKMLANVEKHGLHLPVFSQSSEYYRTFKTNYLRVRD